MIVCVRSDAIIDGFVLKRSHQKCSQKARISWKTEVVNSDIWGIGDVIFVHFSGPPPEHPFLTPFFNPHMKTESVHRSEHRQRLRRLSHDDPVREHQLLPVPEFLRSLVVTFCTRTIDALR